MTMRFSYRLLPTRRPVISLGGRSVRPRPLIGVTLVGSAGAYTENALLDTGADDTVFPEVAANRIGLDLTDAPLGEAVGIAGAPVQVRYAQVALRVTDGQEFREWVGWVAFTPVLQRQPLLGFAGFHQFFEARYLGDQEVVELTVNALYPGT